MEISDIKQGVFILHKGWVFKTPYIILGESRDGKGVFVAGIGSQRIYEKEEILKKFDKMNEKEFFKLFGD